MSRRSFLLDLKAEGALALWHDYRRGDAQDMSGNGNHGVASGDAVFGRDGVRFYNTGLITIPDSSELQMTTGCWTIFGSTILFPSATRWLITKSDAGGVHLELRTNATKVYLYDGVGVRSTSNNVDGSSQVAVNFQSGIAAEMFFDGVTVGGLSSLPTITANDAPLLVGNYYTPSDANSVNFPISSIVMTNRVLTATEHAKLYGELANQDWGQLVL